MADAKIKSHKQKLKCSEGVRKWIPDPYYIETRRFPSARAATKKKHG